MNQNNNHHNKNVNPSDSKSERGSILKPVLLTIAILAAAMSLTYAMVVTKALVAPMTLQSKQTAKPGDDESNGLASIWWTALG